jgi:hypothetical protein
VAHRLEIEPVERRGLARIAREPAQIPQLAVGDEVDRL